MTDIYGQETGNGQAVVYQDATGQLLPGVIRNLHPPIYKADLEVSLPGGGTRFVEAAVYNDGPAAGCWKHDQDQATASAAAAQDAAASADQGDGQDQAAASKKKGK